MEAEALAGIADRRAIVPLVQALQKMLQQPDESEFSKVVGGIAKALQRWEDTRAVEPLILALEQFRMGRRSLLEAPFIEVVQTLVQLRAREAIDPLMTMLRASRLHGRSKACVMDALLELGAAGADELIIANLIAGLEARLFSDRAQAARMLGKLGAVEAIGPLLAHLHDQATPRRDLYSSSGWVDDAAIVRAAVAEALGKLGIAEAVDALISCLQDPDAAVQGSVARALGELGAVQAIQPLITSLKNRGQWRAHAAFAEALGKLEAAEAIEPLVTCLQSRSMPDYGLRVAATSFPFGVMVTRRLRPYSGLFAIWI